MPGALYVAIGILGATVMPHNLYLHSSIVQSREIGGDDASKAEAIRFATFDTVGSLVLALFINAAILVLAGSRVASTFFALALLASGQSSTFTGTIAGQVLMEGSLDLKIPCWQRRLITRFLALAPALCGVWILGEHAIGRMLVVSQVVLSFQLPFAIAPLLLFTGRRALMGRFASGPPGRALGWGLFGVITAANLLLIRQVFA